jgi:Protein of unknown function (DUF3306)
MSDPENFLSRWSRRKREVSPQADPANPPAADETGVDDRPSVNVSPCSAPPAVEPAFDPASLPPIESITAETDISGFLAAGVPPELTRAALRRAWASDPKIRNFVGLADYDWDFNAAGSMAGFGPLEMIDEVGKMAARIVGPDRVEAEASNRLDPASTTPKAQHMARETGPEGDRPAAVDADNQAKQSAERMMESGASPHRDERMGRGHENIAAQDKAEKPDRSSSFVKRQHGGALPK